MSRPISNVAHEQTYRLLLAAVWCTACIRRPVSTDDDLVLRGGIEIKTYGNTDVLLVVDNSASMADKQRLLAQALRRELEVFICPSEDGASIRVERGETPEGVSCTSPLDGARIGLITTDSGSGCGGSGERAHLVPLRDGSLFFDAHEDNARDMLAPQVEQWISSVGEQGCGYEAPLENAYRFLVEPNPLVSGGADSGSGSANTTQSLDHQLLSERAAFVRPDSSLVVLFLTDEDDCSVAPGEFAAMMEGAIDLHSGTSACDGDTNSPCCQSCNDAAATPDGCPPIAEDENCKAGVLSEERNHPNVRCFEQKRRFGVDMLSPIERYVRGFTQLTVLDDSETEVPNPLFTGGKSPDMVHLAVIAGVPWQLLDLSEPTASTTLNLPSAAELVEQHVWRELLGPHADLHLVSSIDPRVGLKDPASLAGEDPINGHEYDNPHRAALQYSCIFPLDQPRDCTLDQCACVPTVRVGDDVELLSETNPLCQAPTGEYTAVQHNAGAFPPPRILEVMRKVGGIVAPICPKETGVEVVGSAYAPVIEALSPWLGKGVPNGACVAPFLPSSAAALERCRVLERLPRSSECKGPDRRKASPDDRFKAVPPGGDADDFTVCELAKSAGDPNQPGTPANACSHDPVVNADSLGYCIIDPERGLGSDALVEFCPDGQRRRVRVMPGTMALPAEVARQQVLYLTCD